MTHIQFYKTGDRFLIAIPLPMHYIIWRILLGMKKPFRLFN